MASIGSVNFGVEPGLLGLLVSFLLVVLLDGGAGPFHGIWTVLSFPVVEFDAIRRGGFWSWSGTFVVVATATVFFERRWNLGKVWVQVWHAKSSGAGVRASTGSAKLPCLATPPISLRKPPFYHFYFKHGLFPPAPTDWRCGSVATASDGLGGVCG